MKGIKMKKYKETCSHNWIHYAGKQCEWDNWSFEDSFNGIKKEDYRKDSNNICYIYICTMCQEVIWSSDKLFDIPHYRVKESLWKKKKQ